MLLVKDAHEGFAHHRDYLLRVILNYPPKINTHGSESRPRKVELTHAQSKNATTVRIYTHNNEAQFCAY